MNGDEHRARVATSTMGTGALLAWPRRARACCGELRHRRVPGGVKGVGTMIVVRFCKARRGGK